MPIDFGILPTEIWQLIFEWVASDCISHQDILPYLYVSKAVHSWLKPRLYTTLYLGLYPHYAPVIAEIRKSPEMFSTYVRRLYINWGVPRADSLVAVRTCVGVTWLAIDLADDYFDDIDLQKAIINIHGLTYMEINIVYLHCLLNTSCIEREDILRWGKRITHLQLVADDESTDIQLPDLTVFPLLSHISICSYAHWLQVVTHVISTVPAVQVVIVAPFIVDSAPMDEQDARVVFCDWSIPTSNWRELQGTIPEAWEDARALISQGKRWLEKDYGDD